VSLSVELWISGPDFLNSVETPAANQILDISSKKVGGAHPLGVLVIFAALSRRGLSLTSKCSIRDAVESLDDELVPTNKATNKLVDLGWQESDPIGAWSAILLIEEELGIRDTFAFEVSEFPLPVGESAGELMSERGEAGRGQRGKSLLRSESQETQSAVPNVPILAMTLFSATERVDPSPCRYGEDSYSFLDRVDQVFWERIRVELESWFSEFPPEEAGDLRARFKSKDPAQHFAAWWELYLFRFFSCLGFQLEIHPDLPGVSGHPDFRVSSGESSFLVEAATTFSGIVDEGRNSTREGWIMAAVEEVKAPDFFVGIQFEKVGQERPSVREIVSRTEAWLAELDPDQIPAPADEEPPKRLFGVRDWSFELTALPVKPEARGKPDHRVLGFGPITAGYVNDVDILGRTLERKRRKYGTPAEPLIFAILLTSPVDNEDIEGALLGRVAWRFDPVDPSADGEWIRQRNGFWMTGGRPRGTRVSAVITATGLMPWNVATNWPRLWPNPWATNPFAVLLPLPAAHVEKTGAVTYTNAVDSPSTVFGLPGDWPGPEKRFERPS